MAIKIESIKSRKKYQNTIEFGRKIKQIETKFKKINKIHFKLIIS